MDDTIKTNNVVDGEILTEETEGQAEGKTKKQTEPIVESGDASVLLSLDELIKSNIAQVDKLQLELRNHREMVTDSFNNNPAYLAEDKKVKEVTKVRNAMRAEILKNPQVATLANKLKDFRLEIKERQQALSDYAQEYERLTGNNEVEGYDGEVREIVKIARLVKKSSKR